MPFPTPTIRIRLTGLLAFYYTRDTANPPNITGLKIGIHDGSKQHKLRISVHKVPIATPELTKENLVLELSEKVKGENITLTVTDPDPKASNVIIAPTSTPPFDDPGDDELGFNLIPDIEGKDFHDKAFSSTFANFIWINNGVFHTRVTKPGWVLREKDGKNLFNPMMGIEAGINIYLKDVQSSQAVLIYSPFATPLVFRKDPNMIHELKILNDCPISTPTTVGMFESDFNLYYSKLALPPPRDDRFSIIFRERGDGSPLSIDHPCGPIRGTKS